MFSIDFVSNHEPRLTEFIHKYLATTCNWIITVRSPRREKVLRKAVNSIAAATFFLVSVHEKNKPPCCLCLE